MKKLVLSAMMAVVLSTVLCAQEKRYGFESAIVKMNIPIIATTSRVVLGTATCIKYIDEYGRKEFLIIERNAKAETFILFIDDYRYFGMLPGTQGVKSKIRSNQDMNFLNLSDEVKTALQIVEKGNEQFLGRDCIRYELKNPNNPTNNDKVTMLVWNGLLLKRVIESEDGLTVAEEVTEIQLDIKIPQEKFDFPEGVTFTEREVNGIIGR